MNYRAGVSGDRLIRTLQQGGYSILRQRGSPCPDHQPIVSLFRCTIRWRLSRFMDSSPKWPICDIPDSAWASRCVRAVPSRSSTRRKLDPDSPCNAHPGQLAA